MASRLSRFSGFGRRLGGERTAAEQTAQATRGRREKRGWWSLSVRGIAVLCLLGAAVIRVWDPFPIETLRLKTFDYYQRLQPRKATGLPVVIVDIDEASLAAYGQWPWPRTLIARLLENLFRSGAVVVGFDVLFAEADRTSPANIAKNVTGLTASTIAQLNSLPTNDKILADVVRRTRTVLGQAAAVRPAETSPASAGRRRKTAVAEVGGNPRPFLQAFPALVPNLAELEDAAKGRGVLALAGEVDGVVRRVPAVFQIDGELRPSLVIEMLRVATGRKAFAVKVNKAGISDIVVARSKIPTDGQGRIWVHYTKDDPRRYLSAMTVLDGSAPRARMAGKLVLIGTSASGLFDVKATPIAGRKPGVEVHAQLLETILAGSHLTRPNYGLGAELVMLLITGLMFIILVPMVGAWWTLLVGAMFGAALAGGSWHLYTNEKTLIDFTFPALASFVIYSVLNFLNYAKEEAGRQQIKTAFSRYLSPEVVTRLAENPRQLALGGQNREMTLLFSDVQGFTSISENYDAEGLTHLVNTVLTPLTEAVLNTGGTVDKYMGDSVMAFWNAPLDDRHHARNACLTALAIGNAIAPLNEKLAAEAAERNRAPKPINVGVGVNSGMCCVGNMGSDLRFDYSVLGDTVNTAARLEGQTRTYRTGNVVGESTYKMAPELAFLELDLVRVVGRNAPVRVFTVVGDENFAGTPEFKALAEAHAAMIAAYRSRDWDGASRALETCRACNPGLKLDGFYDLMGERIAGFVADPPPKDWDAVYEATSKH